MRRNLLLLFCTNVLKTSFFFFSGTGTDIKDKVKMIPSTTALKKILSTSAEESENQAQPLEESSVMSLETPAAEAFQRFLLECDLRESDIMLETSMSDTST